MLFIKKYLELGLEEAVDSLRKEFREHRKDIVEDITKEDISINELRKIINDMVKTALKTLGNVDTSQAILSSIFLF
jgi:flagellar biosynthesis component FlhA